MYAEIIVNSEALEVDRMFTYKVPEDMKNDIQRGCLVKVPFGMGNRTLEGFVYNIITEEKNYKYRIKKITKLCEKDSILSEYNFKIIDFLRKQYLCRYIDAIRLMMPAGIMHGQKNKEKKVISINNILDTSLINKEIYADLYEFIKTNNKMFTKTEIINKGFSGYALNKMIQMDILKVESTAVFRYNQREYQKDLKKTLNEEQELCVNKIIYGKEKKFLIKGVTGSGKTEIYMNIVEHVLNEGKGAIILVPEISLTPQMVERFKGRFGRNVSVFHSRLSNGERFDEWYRVKEGGSKLVIGARSALFLPVQNLGAVIIDEEHENTYKSENNPKYNAIETAEFITSITDSILVLGSATPNIVSYYKALHGEYKLLQLKNRVQNREMPEIELIDMREELKNRNMSIFSRKLYGEIQKTLENKKQVILFLNRRGYSSFVSCRSCGYVFKCPECDVSMTYHKNGYLICHYCGRAVKASNTCPKCKSRYVKYFGTGTEKVEKEVKKYFPSARVLRMDVDTTRAKNSFESIYNSFKNHEADILVGTQMISKGLDFKEVTLVGVLAADISLNIPDYRSAERTYQIITQVAGRAGRGDEKGKVIVQSYTPDHYSLQFAKDEAYEKLYYEEIKLRELMNNPPFGKILLINALSKKEEELKKFMYKLEENLKKILTKETYILGPVPCIVSRIKENYRWQLIIKGDFNHYFAENVKDILYGLSKNVYNEIRVSIDINPNNMN